MAKSRQARNPPYQPSGSPAWGLPASMSTPMLAILTDLHGTLLESVAKAQKDWADFMHRRIQEDVAVARELIGCQSLADMHEVYSQYLKTAFEQYQQQAETAVRQGQSMAQHLARTVDTGAKEAA